MIKRNDSERYILSLDNGGTYIKAALYTEKGRQLAVSKCRNHLVMPQPNYAEYDQDELWNANCNSIKDLICTAGIDPSEIAVIGISGQGGGFYAIDDKGESVRNAIASSDRRALSIINEWKSLGIGDALYNKIFRFLLSGHLSAILAWLKQNEPENYSRIYRLFSMKDYLIYRLTGECVAGYDCLSVSGLMDLNTLHFDADIADKLDISEAANKFGRLVWSTDICGYVSEEAAKRCGCLAGTPVAAGLHDVNASALAMGATTEEHPFIITGTHAINGYVTDQPVLNRIIKNNELFAYKGKFLIEEGYPASSATLDWVLSILFDRNDDPQSRYVEVDAMVESVPDETELPFFFPFLRGHRDDPTARGAWSNLGPEDTKATMLKAVYEGVVFSHMIQIEYLFDGRERPSVFRIAGGATSSAAWIHMFADALGATVEIIPTKEMGTKGVAIASSVACGIYDSIETAIQVMEDGVTRIEPDFEKHALYQKRYARFKELVQRT